MSDLVDRLRKERELSGRPITKSRLCCEAADELDRLSSEVSRLEGEVKHFQANEQNCLNVLSENRRHLLMLRQAVLLTGAPLSDHKVDWQMQLDELLDYVNDAVQTRLQPPHAKDCPVWDDADADCDCRNSADSRQCSNPNCIDGYEPTMPDGEPQPCPKCYPEAYPAEQGRGDE